MVVKFVLLPVLVAVATIINTSTAESNESISNSAFGYELTVAGMDAINMNMQELNSNIESLKKSVASMQELNASIESLKKSVAEIETLVKPSRPVPKTCAEISDCRSGVYRIKPKMECSDAFEVYCDQEYEGGGWLVIQNRYQSSVNFYRGWKEYEAGFGDLRGEFWLGLKKIHEITNAKAHELLIILEDFDGKVVTAQYDRFLVGGPGTKYVLRSLGTYTGTAGDSLRYHAGMKFSTFDNDSSGKDNDKYNHNCAVPTKGGWWYKNSDDNDRNSNCAEFWNGCWHRVCAQSNLNGVILTGHKPEIQCTVKVCWMDSRRGVSYELKRTRMMIRAFNNV